MANIRYDQEPALSPALTDNDITCISRPPFGPGAPFQKMTMNQLATYLSTKLALNFSGNWDASTNTPTLTSGVGTAGETYIVSVPGATTLDGVSNWEIGQVINFDGVAWKKYPDLQSTAIPYADTNANITSDSSFMAANGTGVSVGSPIIPTQVDGLSLTAPVNSSSQDADTAGIYSKNYANSTSHETLNLMSARGTLGAPTILQNGDNFGTIYFSGHDGVEFLRSSAISAVVDGVPGVGAMPSAVGIFTSQGLGLKVKNNLNVEAYDTFKVSKAFATGSYPLQTTDAQMFFTPVKGAFRAGQVSATQWNIGSVGNYSGAIGENLTASGANSFATGQNGGAGGICAVSMGKNAIANGDGSFAINEGTTVTGPNSFVGGFNSSVPGPISIAFGLSNQATQDGNAAIGGFFNTATAQAALCFGGNNNHATGSFSAIIGAVNNNNAGSSSVIVGSGCTITSGANQAFVAGGSNCSIGAGGSNSTVQGSSATANHTGCYVWNMGGVGFATTAPNTYIVRATGGVGVQTNAPQADLHVNGRIATGYGSAAGNTTTANINKEIIGYTNTSSPWTLTLSDVHKFAGSRFTIKDESNGAGTNPITIAPETGTIDGVPSIQIVINRGSATVYSNGINWFVI